MKGVVAGLQSFLLAARAAGIAVGPDEIERLHAVFARAPALDEGTLRALLRCVLAKSRSEREAIDREFEAWIADQTAVLAERPVAPAVDGVPPPPAPPERRFGRRIRILLAAGALAVATAGGLWWWSTRTLEIESRPEPPLPAQEQRELPSPRAPEPGAAPAPTASADPRPTYRTWVAEGLEVVYEPLPWLAASFWFLLAAAANGAILLIRWRYERRIAPEPLGEPRPGPRFQPLCPPVGAVPALLSRRDQRTLVWGIGRFVSEDLTARLDLPATVRATAQQAGFFSPRYERESYAREVWLWRDERTEDPAAARLAAEIAHSLKRANLPVRLGCFDGTPAAVVWENGEHFSPISAEGHRQTALVVLLTDGRALSSALESARTQAETGSALASLATWPRLAVADFSLKNRAGCRALQDRGILCIAPADVPRFLGAAERQRSAFDRVHPLSGERAAWAAALALGAERFDEDTALDLLRALGLDLSAWAVRDLAAAAERRGPQYTWSSAQRAALLDWFAATEPYAPGESEGLMARAARYWIGRYESASAALREQETPQEPFAGTEAERRFELERAFCLLWCDPDTAAGEFDRLSGGPLLAEIRARLGGYQPRSDGLAPHGAPSEDVVRLPWAAHQIGELARWQLWRLGFAGAGSGLVRKRPGSIALATGVCAAVAAGALVLGGLRLRSGVASAEIALIPSAPFPALIEQISSEGDQVIAGSPSQVTALPLDKVRSGLSRMSAVRVRWSQRDLPSVEEESSGNELLLRHGTRPLEPMVRPDGWPRRSYAYVCAEASDVEARRLAIELLDRGTADRVVIGLHGSMFSCWDLADRDTSPDQHLFIYSETPYDPATLDLPGSGFLGPWCAVEGPDFETLRRDLRVVGEQAVGAGASKWSEHGPSAVRLRGPILDLIPLPGATYTIGSPETEDGRYSNETQREVSVGPFEIGRYEITRAQYAAVLGAAARPERWGDPSGDGLLPANCVSWHQAARFCNQLSIAEGFRQHYDIDGNAPADWRVTGTRSDGDGYRLPFEAEWEYAARSGTTTAYFFGADPEELGTYAWFTGNSGDQVHPVGARLENPFGLYDVLGNVWEWCQDEYSRGGRVLRGGSARTQPRDLRCARRDWVAPESGSEYFGFRVVRGAARQP